MTRTSKSLSTFAVAVVAVLAISANHANAVVLFSDTFNRTDANDLNGELTGITNNTGDAFAAGVYGHGHVDPNQPGVPDGVAANGGGASIASGEMHLAVGAGTSNAFVNHNFIDSAILTDGGFSISMDITGYGGVTSSAGHGGGFGIGMSLDEVLSTGDAQNGNTADGESDFKIQDGLQDGSNQESDVAVSDFWVMLRADNLLQWGTKGHNFPGNAGVFGPGHLGSLNVGQQTGTLRADFTVSDFNDGSEAIYRLYFEESLIDTGTFQWTGADENYIGFDARHGSYVGFDNLVVESKEPPPLPTLTVNRDTGNVTLTNQDPSSQQSLVIYSIRTETGGFDQSQWSTIESQGLDTNDTWFSLTDESATYPTDISEGTLGAYSLGANGTSNDSIDFGNIWVPSPYEDLTIEVRDENGMTVPVVVVYTGNDGESLTLGDYNHNGEVDALDWPTVRDNLISDVSALSLFERYLNGDLNNDGRVDQLDFRRFKTLYEADQGEGSFAALVAGTSVPEPTTVALLLGCLSGVMLYRKSRNTNWIAMVALALIAIGSGEQAQAVSLFADSFDRADSRNIDISTTGMSGSVLSSLSADNVYTHAYIDPANDPGPQDGDATNGGGAQVLANELQLAVGAGTSSAFINHNFTDAAILSDGGFSVSVDVTSIINNSGLNQHGGGFALGMTQAEALSPEDAYRGEQDSPVMTSGLNDFTPIGAGVQDFIVSDFWVVLRSNQTLVWGSNTGTVQGLNVGASTGTITAKFATTSFDAGQDIAYEVFFDGTSQGSGVFRWTDDSANYIGLDARDGSGVSFDNLSIESVTDASINTLQLVVNTTTGIVSIAGGDNANTLDFYEISSPGMGLVDGNFTGLQAAAGYPDGTEFGAGWEVNGVQTPSLLSESYIGGSSTIASAATAASLGAIYDTALDSRDVSLTFYDTDGNAYTGFVEYVDYLLPDFNGDGMVNLADYTVWRDNLGRTGASLSQGDATGDGTVDAADYSVWKANFGIAAPGMATLPSNTAVPEPSILWIVGLGLAAGLVRLS
ncbi:dockerin type I domain-containing protein [Aeoliella mucimassa]|uniref:Ice-binding protein C-terminal domain-containing protein n=1 Tax=Aeoliella mucimassa TaxID=2527972 RepID=A0A518AUH8_9BACT|nr:dockerin type I domain-containing protein [Aeoliella mucimassa]QDU58381.1 hypothetical protein Pan181_46150 [Aeoliella mucimassa]